MFKENQLTKEIINLKNKKNAIILAHYYQLPEIQDIADYVGDSLQLAKLSLNNNANIIIFCGVHFMAETAKILSPEKKVLLPDLEAGCSLADSCPQDKFKKFIDAHKDYKVISYINCTAETKALSDIICTSSNAKEIVESFPRDQKLIFAPDKNLGAYINSITNRSMKLWDGVCEVHDILRAERIMKLIEDNPDAKFIAHPECQDNVLKLADFVGSTSSMIKYTRESSAKKFIIATETGIVHKMKHESPEKEFIIVPSDETCNCNDCPDMKKITLEKIYNTLKYENNEIYLNRNLINEASKPLKRMLKIS